MPSKSKQQNSNLVKATVSANFSFQIFTTDETESTEPRVPQWLWWSRFSNVTYYFHYIDRRVPVRLITISARKKRYCRQLTLRRLYNISFSLKRYFWLDSFSKCMLIFLFSLDSPFVLYYSTIAALLPRFPCFPLGNIRTLTNLFIFRLITNRKTTTLKYFSNIGRRCTIFLSVNLIRHNWRWLSRWYLGGRLVALNRGLRTTLSPWTT